MSKRKNANFSECTTNLSNLLFFYSALWFDQFTELTKLFIFLILSHLPRCSISLFTWKINFSFSFKKSFFSSSIRYVLGNFLFFLPLLYLLSTSTALVNFNVFFPYYISGSRDHIQLYAIRILIEHMHIKKYVLESLLRRMKKNTIPFFF